MRWMLCAIVALWGCDDGGAVDPAPRDAHAEGDALPDARADAQPDAAAVDDAQVSDARLSLDAAHDAAPSDADMPDAGLLDQGACVPACADAECGPDGCGGRCGECAGLCEAGQCALPPTGIIIAEFLASNPDGADWIELQNRGRAAVDLTGWYLTDDLDDRQTWTFPALQLPAGAIHVIESGPGGFDFGLRADGEALALVWRDGETIVDAYAPAFPAQRPGISHGVAQQVEATVPVELGDVVRWRPSAGGDWMASDFDDTDWSRGATGIGFGAQPGDAIEEVAAGQPTSQTSTLADFDAGRAVNGDLNDFTHTVAADDAPVWRVTLPDARWIDRVVLHNRRGCCGSRLRDITVRVHDADDAVVWTSPVLNPENTLGSPATLQVEPGVEGRVVSVTRTPDPDFSGGAGNGDEATVLSLGEVEVFAGVDAFAGRIATPIEPVAGIQLRVPFDLDDPAALSRLALTMQTDAGFAVWLNGARVGGHRAPDEVDAESRATGEADGVDIVTLSLPLDQARVGANLLAIQALDADGEDLLAAPRLVAQTVVDGDRAYFEAPTPGEYNDQPGFAGFVERVRFDPPSGLIDGPLEVRLHTLPEDAEIRFTTDGSDPRDGQIYAGPIAIERSTSIRAIATAPGWRDGEESAGTWIILSDVAAQTADATRARGFPDRWGGVEPDYGIDARVVDADPDAFAAALRAAPTLSISTDIDGLFGDDGIYTQSTRSGIAYERVAAVDLLPFGDEPGFQVTCGLRIQGGAFRNHGLTKKHSLRLLFKGIYGPTKLEYPLYSDADAVDRFDTLTLRANSNDGWQWGAARERPLYIRDAFGRATRRAMGGVASHGRFAHVYLNGIYWGVYEMTERPAASFAASYLGGDKDDWDALNSGSVVDGDAMAWRMLLELARAGLADDAAYAAYVDEWIVVESYIDYMLTNLYVGNTDWPHKNYYAARDRVRAAGFYAFMWDSEWSMGIRSDLNTNRVGVSDGIAAPWDALKQNAEFRLRVGDRAHRHLLGDGALTPDAAIARFVALADAVEGPLVAESARWGDQHAAQPYTVDAHWRPERDRVLANYLPLRSGVFLAQLRAANLYPAIDGPLFAARAGALPVGVELPVEGEGTLYFTQDGTDPRAPGGGVSPTAQEGAIVPAALGPVTIKARLWVDGVWSALEVGEFVIEP